MAETAAGLSRFVHYGGGNGDVIQEALHAIRLHLGMEVAYFSEFVGGKTVFRRVDAPGLEHLIKVGDELDLDSVYCTHILEGRLPELMPDTSLEPVAQSMAITQAVPIGAHVSVPVKLADGRPFGMFCCLSPRPNPSLNDRDLAMMKVFADLATKQVDEELRRRQAVREKRLSVRTVMAEQAHRIVFQPIYDLRKLEPVGYEALCRFAAEPVRSPDKWFADAAEIGLGVELELKVIETALATAEAIPDGLTVWLNASPSTVMSGGVDRILRNQRWERVVLELTEHAKVEDYAGLSRRLARLKNKGVTIAVDDAGAGYSGLRHIVQLAPDIIKMDMSLTRDIDKDPARRALAGANDLLCQGDRSGRRRRRNRNGRGT